MNAKRDSPRSTFATCGRRPGELLRLLQAGQNDLNVNFETSLFKLQGDKIRFFYPADHPLPPEFEEQMTKLVRGGAEVLAGLTDRH